MKRQVKKIVKSAKMALECGLSDPELIKIAIQECSKGLRTLRDSHLRKAKTVGAKQSALSAIALILSYRTQLKHCHSATGAGLDNKNRGSCTSSRVKWEDSQSAFDGRIQTGVIANLTHKEPKSFLEDCGNVFQRKIRKALTGELALKVNAIFCGEFHVIKGGEEFYEEKFMNTKNALIYRETDLGMWFNEHIQAEVLKKLEEFQERDSGWALAAIVNLTVCINKFTPQLGSSYIPLPKSIVAKNACINVKNNDDACFAWAVVSALYPADHHFDRMSSYPDYHEKLNMKGLQLPMIVGQVPRFERQNSLSINVYILKKTKKGFIVLPTYLTKDKKDRHVNLLIIQDVYYEEKDGINDKKEVEDDAGPIRYHYVWIKNLSRLLSHQTSNNQHQIFFCDRCLHYFYSAAKLEAHVEDCYKLNNCRIQMPTEEKKWLSFKNHKNKVSAPFVIYADLECLLVSPPPPKKPASQKKSVSRKKEASQSIYQDHIPHSVAYYVKCAYDPTLSFYRSHRGSDCIEWFVRELEEFAEDVEPVFLCALPIDTLTVDQIREFDTATECHICEKPFTTDDKKVRDHCHLTGNYRGPAHEGCNINFKDTQTIPVIFHNLSGYDSHFIIKNIAKDLKGRVDLLPINKERYISFTKRLDEYLIKYRFIDSFKFMNSGLEKLASYLTSCPILKSEFSDLTEPQLNLLTRKGVFPYDYCDSVEKFNDTCLPDISQFYNKLNDCQISKNDYAHAQEVWSGLNISNLGKYSDIYLKTDVLLLADVFEQFRSSCHKTYGLDPAHYFTLPGYTWDAMLKHTDITLELLTDVDMLLFVEQGIRGGLSQCSKRYTKGNNKYLPDYDAAEPSKYLMYFDVNNQYGWAMSQHLPYGNFSWVGNYQDFIVEDVADDSDIGYIIEVDLEYPSDLHDHHKDLPFCPEHATPPGTKQKKLLATLHNKSKYVIHYRALKQALKYGLKLKKIHRILQFDQAAWLKSYIDLNTCLRTVSKSEFDKNLYKLMNNAVFGKTMENIRKHCIVKLLTKRLGRYGFDAYVSKPEFKSSTIFAENFVAVELNKTEILFNKPIYVGMSILDLAKTTIYDFHYGTMIPEFDKNCTVCYTDTDSLIYEVTCPNLYEFIKRDAVKYFDTSDYPKDNSFNIPNTFNKKVLGMMKDENNGRVMSEFVGLRSKMYAIRVEGVEQMDEARKSKGVKKYIVKNQLKFDDYLDCLNTGVELKVNQNLIRSKKHTVSSTTQSKIALSPHDDKRFLIKNSYETLAWGHYSIMDVE